MQTPFDIGVDVAKEQIMIAAADGQWPARPIANRRAALSAWLKTLPAGSRIGLEATGSYHLLLAELAVKKGFTVYVLNPRDTRHYARAIGARAKTDRVDAELLARYVMHEHTHLHAYRPPSASQRRIDALLRRRTVLVKAQGALRQSFQGVSGFRAELTALHRRFDALLVKIDAQLAALSAGDPVVERLQSIVGVGPLVSHSLANTFQRLPFASADAFIAYCGYDPRPQDSGQKRGRRRLSKRGPGELRRLLFNAAMAAIKSRSWKPLYEHHRARGWSSTAALVSSARKIARVAYALFKHNTTFEPLRLTQGLT